MKFLGLILVLLLGCNREQPQVRLLSDNPWLWSAVSAYNLEHRGGVLVVFDYQPSIESWLANPAYRKAQVIVTNSTPKNLPALLPLNTSQIISLSKKTTYTGVTELLTNHPHAPPLLLHPPLYLVTANQPWSELKELSPPLLTSLDLPLLSSRVPELVQEAVTLTSHPLYQGQQLPPSWLSAPQGSTTPLPWYARLRWLGAQLPLLPISLPDYQEIDHKHQQHYRALVLADEQGRWLPRQVSRVMVVAEQDSRSRKESLLLISWLLRTSTHRKLALQPEVPGMLGSFSIYPEVDREWMTAKLPSLLGYDFTKGILAGNIENRVISP